MSYALQYEKFYNKKNSFFQRAASNKHQDLIKLADDMVAETDYSFIAWNQTLLKDEFEQLFASLKARKKNRKDLWVFCYYCTQLLAIYHRGYDQEGKAQEYDAISARIDAICKGQRPAKKETKDDPFLTRVCKMISRDILDMAKIPTQVSKLRDKATLGNIIRIYWAFCRLTFTSSLRLLRDVKILDLLNQAVGKNIDVDAIIQTIEAPNSVFRVLSVGFFVARLLLNGLVFTKHMVGSSKLEKSQAITERLSLELYKRHPVLLNDVVWAVVNGVTNYAEVFHISAAAAGWITAGFLAFDVALILWRRHLAEQEYLTKKAQYTRELATHWEDNERCAVLNKQLQNLEISWQAKNATFLFNASAALMLGLGFSASMLVSSPLLIIASYAVCMVAVAMYLSDGAYNSYKEKSLHLQQAHLENVAGEDLARVLKAYQAARNEFIFTMIKNTVMPTLILATFAVCWQAAVVLIAVYAAYELWNAYCKRKKPDADPEGLVATSMEDGKTEIEDDNLLSQIAFSPV